MKFYQFINLECKELLKRLILLLNLKFTKRTVILELKLELLSFHALVSES